MAVPRGPKLVVGSEVMALKHLLNVAVEAFEHSVGLGRFRRGQAVLDTELGA